MIHPLRIVTMANPAVSTDFVYTQPGNLVSRLRAMTMYVQNGGLNGARVPIVSAFEPGGLRMTSARWLPLLFDSGDAYGFLLLDTYFQPEAHRIIGAIDYYWRESPVVILLPGWVFRSEIDNIQVGDQISDVRLEFEDLNLRGPGVVG